MICEVLDSRTQKTISSSQYMKQSSGFCQTNKITAQILAMVAENRSTSVLFEELFGTCGNSVNVHNASRYVEPFEEVSFWTIAKRASRKRETLIGYISRTTESVCLNPIGKEKQWMWEDYDMIVISTTDALNISSVSRESVTADAYKIHETDPHDARLPPELEVPSVWQTNAHRPQGVCL